MGSLTAEIEKLLLHVEKPGRYCGGEFNSIVKKDAAFRMALSYPDLYEIGMANHGLRILYDLVNRMDGCACERVFSIPDDFRILIKENNIPLFTLETRTSLAQCDLVAFNASHELLYTNILQILELGNIPLHRTERNDPFPLVCLGGDAASNPFPMSSFADFFFLGEGEEGIIEIVSVLRAEKEKGSDKKSILESLSRIEGVVISEYLPEYGKTRSARKREYRGLPHNPSRPVVPSMRISQDKAVVEVMRGCANLCTFCHAGFYSLPCRHVDHNKAAEDARNVIKGTGYDDVTFLSLSIGDYDGIADLLNEVLPELNEQGVSISLPSLKIDEKTLPVIKIISNIRKTSITFAVEAADEQMRKLINKKLTIDELERILSDLFSDKWDTVKFYFMIGLPGFRENSEVDAIIALLKRIDELGKKRKNLNVTVSPFIPKPHTPLEVAEMADEPYFRETVKILKDGPPRRITIKNHNIGSSIIEGLCARGDEKVGAIIESAYRKGAILDSWDEHFRYDIWREAIAESGIDVDVYRRSRSREELPWTVFDTGYVRLKEKMYGQSSCKLRTPGLDKQINTEAIAASFETFKKKYECNVRVRIRCTKTGAMKYISHLDYMEVVKRGLRIIGMPVSFTQGFNKHERIAAGFPLPLGIESETELFDLDLYAAFNPEILKEQALAFPEGVRITDVAVIETKASLMAAINALSYRITADDCRLIDMMKARLATGEGFTKTNKEGKSKDITFEQAVRSFSGDGSIDITLNVGTPESLRIDQVVMQLSGREDALDVCRVVKTGQYAVAGGECTLI